MEKISVVLNTYNAEEHLREVLESVKEFDEIVVCDMESTDRTREIAAEYGAKIVIFPKGDHKICEPARDTAIHSASNDWVLVVDADEKVPDALREYLYAKINSGFVGAMAVPRLNQFMSRAAHGSPDRQLRFFRQSKATWPPVIHARPATAGPVVDIPATGHRLSLIHLDNPTLRQRYDKLNRYSDYEVPRRINKKFGTLKLLFKPLWAFLSVWLLRGAWRDGRRGLINAYTAMIYKVMLMSKVTEAQLNEKDRSK